MPSFAKAKLDFRLVGEQNPDKVFQLLREHLDRNGFTDIEAVQLSGCHPAKTDPNDPLVRTVVDNVKDVYGQEPVVLRNTPGTGPMYDLCQKYNIPAISLGVGNEDSRNHAPNENIAIDDYILGIKMMSKIIHEFAN